MFPTPQGFVTGRLGGRGEALRVLMLLILTLFLLIPVLFITFLVQERQGRRREAVAEVTSKWGQAQQLHGPALVVPFTERVASTDARGVATVSVIEGRLVLLPDSLDIAARLTTQVRHRGIYQVPVYQLRSTAAGHFVAPDFTRLGIEPASIQWTRAALVVGIADSRAIQEQASLQWGDRAVAMEPGNAGLDELGNAIHAELGLTEAPWGVPFSLPLVFNGSESVQFTPFGRETRVELSGDWPAPSFQGAWLPAAHTVADSGFRANWRIPSLGRSYPQAWRQGSADAGRIQASGFGLRLSPDVDAYRMCERTLKYSLLFFLLTFTAFWLLEVLGGRPLHPIQYALIGAALCVFMMLELALSEHIGFGPAYGIASAMVVALIVHYAAAILGSMPRAVGVGAGLAGLYAFHYVVLRNEDYALLLGSLLLFGTLAAVMSATRRIHWDAPREPAPPSR